MDQPVAIVTGAAGFIGSHLCDQLLARNWCVAGIDNLRLGRRENLVDAFRSPRFTFLEADANDWSACLANLRVTLPAHRPVDTLWHLAANSDIRAGVADPDVDLQHTFLSTYHTLRLARELGCRRFAFASSSAIYGPHPHAITEDAGPLQPISNYGAMKLASEAVVSAALETQLDRAWIFRFPNVVGPRSTHGVIHDFLEKLARNRTELEVLGDGSQEKPYLHVQELVDAMLWIHARAGARLNCFNIGPRAGATTVRHIAQTVLRHASPHAAIRYTGGTQGWPGDVPRFTYTTDRLRALGWEATLTSDQAVERAVAELAAVRHGQKGAA